MAVQWQRHSHIIQPARMWTLGWLPPAVISFLSSVNVRQLDLGLTFSGSRSEQQQSVQAGDFLGFAMVASEDYLVVGAPYANGREGDVIAFEKNLFSDDYSPADTFYAGIGPDGQETGPLGHSVAVMDNIAIVGMPYAPCIVRGTVLDECGRVAMYEIGTDTVVHEITPDDGGEEANFGYALALSGDKLAVGEPGQSSSVGKVWIYSMEAWGDSGITTTVVALLQSPDENQGADFGAALAFEGKTLFVGSPGSNFNGYGNAGQVHIYTFDQNYGSWVYSASVGPTTPVNNGRFGGALATDGNVMVAGSVLGNGISTHAGCAHVYLPQESEGVAVWSLKQVIYAHDGVTGDYFGCSVAVSGDYVAVGACNEAGKVLSSGNVWQEYDGYMCGDLSHDDCVSVGEEYTLTGSSVGAVYLYRTEDKGASGFQPFRKLLGSKTSNGFFGHSLAFSSKGLFVGAPGALSSGDALAVAGGAIYVISIGPVLSIGSALNLAATYPLATGGVLAVIVFLFFICCAPKTPKLISARAPVSESSSHGLLNDTSTRSNMTSIDSSTSQFAPVSDVESSSSTAYATDPIGYGASARSSAPPVRTSGWRPQQQGAYQ